MLTARQVEAFLHQFEPLRQVTVREESQVIEAPWLVELSGSVMLYGEPHFFEAKLNLKEVGGVDDLMKLVEQLLKTFAAASRVVAKA